MKQHFPASSGTHDMMKTRQRHPHSLDVWPHNRPSEQRAEQGNGWQAIAWNGNGTDKVSLNTQSNILVHIFGIGYRMEDVCGRPE